MKNFAVFINPELADKDRVFDLLNTLHREHGIVFYGALEQCDIFPNTIECCPFDPKKLPRIDCVLVFGGDGTILRAKQIAIRTAAPILGINLGYLGFLSESSLNDLRKSIKDILQKKYKILNRMLINCQLKRDGKVIFQELALNDAVIYKAETPRLINVRIYNEQRFVLDTRCDGVVVSTPTGSTAYSLSAGGPIMSPEMKAIVISPLNPHLLSIRPMVFPAKDKLLFKVHNIVQHAWLQMDGINAIKIEDGDELSITAARQTVSFIKLSNRTFFQILRNKLHLGK